MGRIGDKRSTGFTPEQLRQVTQHIAEMQRYDEKINSSN